MKLICSQSNLNANLSLVSRAVSSRPTHPVLANVLLNADEETQTVKLCAFDLSLGIQTSFPAQVKSGGVLTLPAKLLGDIISRLPDGEITLDDGAVETDAGITVTITSASGRYQVRGLGADDFPELPTIEDGDSVELPAEALIDGLKSSLFSASSDETKQVLTGVHLNVQSEGLEFAATDGHRLAVVQTVNEEGAPAQETLAVTVPAKALQELIKMLERSSNTSVAVKFDPAQAVFEWGDQRLTSRLLEAQYPNYQQLLPKQFSHQMTVDRRLFLGALERISVLADQRNNIVKLSLDPAGTVQVSVDAQDVGSGQETVEAQISGEAMDVAFNVRYLIEGLKVVTSTEVQLQLNTPTSPAVLVPLGSLKMQYLVMPVQIRS